jgi:hypothetical protein
MIKHVVMFKLSEHAENSTKSENAQKIKSMLDDLPGKIKEIRGYEIGINLKESERSMDLIVIGLFDDLKALDQYSQNLEHLKVVEYILPRISDTMVVDFEI